MIINSLRLLNFKNYKGEHFIDFSLHDHSRYKKNIILIGGLNGAGKTTILEAIKLCLYGKKLNGHDMKPEKYMKMILSKVNSTAIAESETRCSITVVFQLDEGGQNLDLSVCRDWFFIDGKLTEEKFTLTSDGKELEIVPREIWEDYIFSLIPQHVSDFFFFDGERIKEIASGVHSKENLRDTIQSLLGLRKYENLERDLMALVRTIKRRNVRDEKVRNCLEDKQRVLSSIEKELRNARRKIQHKKSLISELGQQHTNLEKEIRRKAGEFALKKNEYQKECMSLEKDVSQIDKEIGELCEGHLPFIIASGTRNALISQLRNERKKKEWESAARLLEETRDSFIKKLTQSKKISEELTETQKNLIMTELHNIFSSIQKDMGSISSLQTIHDLSDSESIEIEMFLSKISRDMTKTLKGLLHHRERNKTKLKQITNRLRKIPEGIIESEISMLTDLRSRITTLEDEILTLSEKRNQIEFRIKRVHEEIEKLEEQIVCVEDDERKIEICLQTISAIRGFKSVLISTKIRDLETKVSEAYRQLANKGDLVAKIEMCPESFNVNLIDFKGNKIDKDSLSTGEQEIYAISVLWGLAEIVNYKMPMIIDTPLAKLDNKHVNKITRKFFPAASHQVVLLSQDREIDAKLYKDLKPNIDHSLLLSLGEENKVQEGYFFG
ncbi:MAG: DNA sulfur modification protein DndD [Methanocellales archaeon]|nr:DNA sulfur modification protein DndD [Methanocellales archaeon]